MGFVEELELDGWARLPGRLDQAQLAALEGLLQVQGAFSRRPAPLGLLGSWLSATPIPQAVAAVLGPSPRPVRAFWLDKNPDENWALAWHQDTTVALAECKEVEGFSAWVNKAHFFHAQAPPELMARMLSTRIHLDEASAAQGAMKVLSGTHLGGRLDDASIAASATRVPPTEIPAHRGETVLMRPLLLHGSDRATTPRRRRVLHLEWAAFDPPGGLRWAWF